MERKKELLGYRIDNVIYIHPDRYRELVDTKLVLMEEENDE